MKKSGRRGKNTYEIRGFDECFESGIALDVELVKLDAVRPGKGPVEEVVDFLRGDVHHYCLVVGFRHELLAEVRSNEAAAANHAY